MKTNTHKTSNAQKPCLNMQHWRLSFRYDKCLTFSNDIWKRFGQKTGICKCLPRRSTEGGKKYSTNWDSIINAGLFFILEQILNIWLLNLLCALIASTA